MTLELQSFTQQKKIPGPPVLPIVGSLPFIEKHQHLAFTRLARKYGDVFQINLFGRNIVVLNGLETIKKALLQQSEVFAGRPDAPITKIILEGNTLAPRDYGLTWKRHREIAVNALHMFTNRQTLEQQIIEEAVDLANIFLSCKDQPFDPRMDIYLSMSNVMSTILFGEKFNRNNPDFIGMMKLFQMAGRIGVTSMRLAFAPIPPGMLKFMQSATSSAEVLMVNKLKEQKKSYDPEKLRGMVDALLKAFNEIDDFEKHTLGLTEELIVEGTAQESMAATMQVVPIIAWALLYMIAYPDIQAQVQQELGRVIGQEQALSYDQRTKLPFTQACIYEILRHAAYFPTALPHSPTRDTSINGYFIPKGTPVYVNLYSLTRDTRYWEEPEKFNPHRFLSKTGEIREDLLDRYYPFGLGKRRCTAEHLSKMEIFLFFANLMHRCNFTKVTGAKLSFESQTGGVTMPKQRYQIIVTPRF
jgi:cytochrome P450